MCTSTKCNGAFSGVSEKVCVNAPCRISWRCWRLSCQSKKQDRLRSMWKQCDVISTRDLTPVPSLNPLLSFSSFSPFVHFSSNPSCVTQLTPRERAAVNYTQKLKEKFQHHPQVRRIAHHRHLPKNIYHQKKELQIMKEARRRKYEFIIFPLFFSIGIKIL